MKTSPTDLKKPLYVWLARILGLGIILASIGINLAVLPEYLQNIWHQGYVWDVYYSSQLDGTSMVEAVSSEAAQKGIAVGDKLLNPEEDTLGEVGTQVTLRIQTGDLPVREATFVRTPSNSVVWGGMLFGLSQKTSTVLALLFVLIPVILGGMAALLIYWRKSDDWMAVLTGIVLTLITTIPSDKPYVVIFGLLTLPLSLAWLILFPNGKLAPRWSWVPIFLLLPKEVLYSLINLGFLSDSFLNLAAGPVITVLSAVGGLGLLGVMLYRYLRLFSPMDRQQSKAVIVPLLVGLAPIVILELISGLYWSSSQIETGLKVGFVSSAMALILACLVILGALVSIFRYRSR